MITDKHCNAPRMRSSKSRLLSYDRKVVIARFLNFRLEDEWVSVTPMISRSLGYENLGAELSTRNN